MADTLFRYIITLPNEMRFVPNLEDMTRERQIEIHNAFAENQELLMFSIFKLACRVLHLLEPNLVTLPGRNNVRKRTARLIIEMTPEGAQALRAVGFPLQIHPDTQLDIEAELDNQSEAAQIEDRKVVPTWKDLPIAHEHF